MRPNRPLPTLPFAKLPLRRDPNAAAAIIAARITRGHRTSVRFSHIMSLVSLLVHVNR
jgi:ABC-type microcin C transport system permease subunit YejE